MATLTGSTIASSYEQLLSLPDGGGNTSNLVAVTDGDAGTTFAMQLSTTTVCIDNPTADSSTQGGILRLQSDDGALMQSGSRLGVIEFAGAEDSSNTITVGGRIESVTDAAWSATENGADMVFYTTDGNAAQSEHFRIKSGGLLNVTGPSTHSQIDFHGSDGVKDGSVYAESTSIGFLDDDGNWAVRVHADTSTSLYVNNSIKLLVDANSRISLSNNDGNTSNTVFGYHALTNAGTVLGDVGADYNTAVGHLAMGTGTTLVAINNTAVGYKALEDITAGDYNVAIGVSALAGLTDGEANIAVGRNAGLALTSQTTCVLVGHNAGAAINNDTANGSVAVGFSALTALTSGASNTAVGYQALQQQTDGANNVAIGYTALNTANTGESNNISIGYQSMLSVDHADADNNVVIGHQAGIGGGAAMSGCVAIGANAMDSTAANAQTGTIAIGQSALTALTSGAGNTAVGYQSGLAITTGANNTALGYTALDELVDGSGNTAIGSYAMGDTVGGTTSDGSSNNTAVGYNAAGGNWADQDCSNIVAIGHNALAGALAGDGADGSVAVGKSALAALTSGAGNTAVGYVALTANLVGSANTALGHSALKSFVSDTSGHGNNTALGYFAGAWVDDGTENTFVGASSGQGITGTRLTGNLNTALGFESGLLLQGAAVNNTLIGARAGDGVTTGDQNTGIGAAVAFDVDAGNQTCVGYQATTSAANAVKIGNGSVSAANIQVDWTIDSDSRIKKDIKDSDVGLSFINALKPRKYKRRHPSEWDSEILEKRYKQGGGNYDDDKDEVIKDEFDDSKTWDGLIAQEVKEVIDKSGTTFSGWSEDGDGKQGIQYSSLVVPLIKAVQELTAKVEALENK